MVSIVIPLFNMAAEIERALWSVLNQLYDDFECLVIDDGSTDKGGELVRQFRDRRIRYFRQGNAGVSAARNRGIELAQGVLVAFLDADDEWLPDFLSRSVAVHQAHPDIVASFSNYSRERGGAAVIRTSAVAPRVLRDYFAFCLSHKGLGMWTSAVTAKREALVNIKGFPVGRAAGEDLETWARLAWSGCIAFLPQALSIYHGDNAASRSRVPCVDVLPTFSSWRSRRQIPERLTASSEAYAYFFRFFEVYTQIAVRQTAKGRTLLTEVPWAQRLSLMGCMAQLGLTFPGIQRYSQAVGLRLGNAVNALRWKGRAG